MTPAVDHGALPYRIAVLCYLYDDAGRILMLHRLKAPNAGMHSPIGGKLEVVIGEGPHDCARREIREEAGLDIPPGDIRLMGLVSETAYQKETHWLIFLFEVMRPVDPGAIPRMSFDEGSLRWVDPADVPSLDLPETDRRVMWPLVLAHRGGGFFMVHIDCRGDDLVWTVHERTNPGADAARTHPAR